MPIAKNDQEMMTILIRDFASIIDKVAGRVVEEIVKPSVTENVYESYFNPDSKYERLGEVGGFISSWNHSDVIVSGNEISSEVAVDPSLMILNKSTYTHGSEAYGDVRNMLDQYIAEGTHYNFNFNMERDYWTPIEEAVKNGTIDKIIEEEMTRKSIVWIKKG